MTYLKEDLEFVHRLLKQGGATNHDVQVIYQLYNKYIEPGTLATINTGCSSCSTEIHIYWAKLKGFMAENAAKFVD